MTVLSSVISAYYFHMQNIINLNHPDLIPHVQGQASQYLSIMPFVSRFYAGGHASCYTFGPSKLCHRCVTYVHKRLNLNALFKSMFVILFTDELLPVK
jgi:hypothetical protein